MRLLGGRPLLQYSIEAGLASRRLDHLLLTSDDPAMMALARQLGCDAPFQRPADLAGDSSPMIDVVLHAVDWIERERGTRVENVVLLQPTQPFRSGADIDEAIAAFDAAGAETLFSVEDVAQHPCECVALDEGSRRVTWALEPPPGAAGRQAFPHYYYINGAIYITAVTFLRQRRAFQDERTAAYIMPRARGLDINDAYDFHVAQGLTCVAASGEPVFDDVAKGERP
jgi:CMP-N-acetylneuraminic acid synthetase